MRDKIIEIGKKLETRHITTNEAKALLFLYLFDNQPKCSKCNDTGYVKGWSTFGTWQDQDGNTLIRCSHCNSKWK